MLFFFFFTTKQARDVEKRALNVNKILYTASGCHGNKNFFPVAKRSSRSKGCARLCFIQKLDFRVTTECSKQPEKQSLLLVGCSRVHGLCDLAGGLPILSFTPTKIEELTAVRQKKAQPSSAGDSNQGLRNCTRRLKPLSHENTAPTCVRILFFYPAVSFFSTA